MKQLLFIALIMWMGVQPKENNMQANNNGSIRRPATTPAWAEAGRGRGAGASTPVTNTNTNLGNALGASGTGTAGRRNSTYEDNFSLTPSGIGGGNAAVPNFNTPASITSGQETPRPAWVNNIQGNLPNWARPGQASSPNVSSPSLWSVNNITQPISSPLQPASRWNPGGYRPSEQPTTIPTTTQQPATGGFGGSIYDNYTDPGIAAANASGVMDAYNYGNLQSAGGAGGYFDRWKALNQPVNNGGGYGKYWRGGGGGGFGTNYGWDNADYQPRQYTQTAYPADMGLFQLNWKG